MTQRYLEQYEDVKFQTLQGANARKVVLMVGIMAAHALGEGSGVGVSFCGQQGWSQVNVVTLHFPKAHLGSSPQTLSPMHWQGIFSLFQMYILVLICGLSLAHGTLIPIGSKTCTSSSTKRFLLAGIAGDDSNWAA